MALTEGVVFAHLPGGFAPAKLALTETERVVEASSFAYGTRCVERADAFRDRATGSAHSTSGKR